MRGCAIKIARGIRDARDRGTQETHMQTEILHKIRKMGIARVLAQAGLPYGPTRQRLYRQSLPCPVTLKLLQAVMQLEKQEQEQPAREGQ